MATGPYGTGIPAPPNQPTGSQYGEDQILDLNDLGMPGLSLTDQQYLAGLGQYYNPDDPAAIANAEAWNAAMMPAPDYGALFPPAPGPQAEPTPTPWTGDPYPDAQPGSGPQTMNPGGSTGYTPPSGYNRNTGLSALFNAKATRPMATQAVGNRRQARQTPPVTPP